MYVALSCLVQQLKTESRADVFTVVRKLRSQRQGMIQNVVSYCLLRLLFINIPVFTGTPIKNFNAL